MSVPENDSQTNFVALLTSHQALLHSYVLSLMPHYSEAEDIVQEANLILWKKREEFVPGTNFKAWALTVCRFQVMSYRKRLAMRKTDRLSDAALDLIAAETAEEDAEIVLKYQSALRVCFQKLASSDRDLLLKRYWNRMSLRDFAEVSKISEQAVKSKLHRLRAALRKCVAQTYSEEHP